MIDILRQINKVLNINLRTFNLIKKSTSISKDISNILFVYTKNIRFIIKDISFLENLTQQIDIKNKFFFNKISLYSKLENHLKVKGL